MYYIVHSTVIIKRKYHDKPFSKDITTNIKKPTHNIFLSNLNPSDVLFHTLNKLENNL